MAPWCGKGKNWKDVWLTGDLRVFDYVLLTDINIPFGISSCKHRFRNNLNISLCVWLYYFLLPIIPTTQLCKYFRRQNSLKCQFILALSLIISFFPCCADLTSIEYPYNNRIQTILSFFYTSNIMHYEIIQMLTGHYDYGKFEFTTILFALSYMSCHLKWL